MRVVIDTNVLLASLRSKTGLPSRLHSSSISTAGTERSFADFHTVFAVQKNGRFTRLSARIICPSFLENEQSLFTLFERWSKPQNLAYSRANESSRNINPARNTFCETQQEVLSGTA